MAYIYGNYSSLLKTGSSFRKGAGVKMGLGYKFFLSQKLCLMADIGYSATLVSLTNEGIYASDRTIGVGGTVFGLGFVLF